MDGIGIGRIIGFVFLFFLFAWFKSCQELEYFNDGQLAEAEISGYAEVIDGNGMHAGTAILFKFFHQGLGREVEGNEELSDDEAYAYEVGQTIAIEYVGDKIFSTRLAGSGSFFWPGVAILGLTLIVGYLAKVLFGPPKRAT